MDQRVKDYVQEKIEFLTDALANGIALDRADSVAMAYKEVTGQLISLFEIRQFIKDLEKKSADDEDFA